MDYRRAYVKGGCYFFTAVLADRKSQLLTDRVDLLRECIKTVKDRKRSTNYTLLIRTFFY